MSDADQEASIGDVELSDDNVLSYSLTSDAVARIHARDDGDLGVEVVVIDGTSESAIYHDSHKRDFYTKQTKLQIKNQIRESHHDGDAIGSRFVEFCKLLTNNHDAIQRGLRPPAVGSLIDQTDKVEILGGPSATFIVTMTRDGCTRKLEFSADEIMGTNPTPLRSKYGSAFYEKVSLEPEVWEDLAEEWIDMAEEVAAEHMTESEAVANEIVTLLTRRLAFTLDREALHGDKLTGWYDEDNATDNADVTDAAGHDAPVVWVRTDAIRDALKDEGKEKNYFNRLSPELKSMGLTYTTSTQIRTDHGRVRCLGFNPTDDGIGIPRSAATEAEEVLPQ